MGVDNLLGFVDKATTNMTIKRAGLPNSTAAIDASHWIYKACYACPEALYYRDKMHHVYSIVTNYIDNYVQLLRSYNIKLVFVFDGMKLPAKRVTHKERAERKSEARKRVEKLLAAGNAREARKHMFSCVEIKFDIVQQVMSYCKRLGIDYIVAPYEADAQLAFLANSDQCDFVITEDTDLILYGCRKIIYKLDTSGNCRLYERSRLSKCFGPRGDEVSFEKFRRICILSGCDYLKNIPSIGLQSAKKFFLMTKQDNLRLLLPKLPSHLKSTRLAGKVTEEYIEGFIKAEEVFRHHIVYDPQTERLRPLEPYPRGKSARDFPLAGRMFHRVLAMELVKGKIDLDNLNPEADLDSSSSSSETEDEDGAAGDSADGGSACKIHALDTLMTVESLPAATVAANQ